MRKNTIYFFVCLALLALLDQVVLTSALPETALRYSNLTTHKKSAAGFFTPGCSASAHRLTLISRSKLRSKPEQAIHFDGWRQGNGMLKLPTWGCGLAFYDNGGDGGRIEKMYKWGEGRKADIWLGRKAAGCGEMTFILIEEARVLCVSGAETEKYLAD